MGRIFTSFGVSGSGKSLIAANTAALALKNNKVDVVYIFDSEGGTLVNIFKQHSVDMSKVNHIPVASIEQCSTKML
jgi:MinD-like ATPase involved in chromosome partitioning or flagellar assembly